jgi:tetratricopeptide (TPR) repeat protein
MKRWINILVFLCLSLVAFAQEETRVVDSLLSVLPSQEGREKVESMMELSKVFFDFSFDDCINWGEKAIIEAAKFQDEELLAKAYWKIGLRYLNHYEFDLALSHFDHALALLENNGDSELLMDVLNYKGRVELFMGEMDAALVTYRQAMKVSENLGDEMNCADVTNNLAYIYFQQDDLDQALECFKDARKRYGRIHDTLSMAQCDNNISNIYVQWQQYDEALALLKQAIPIFEQNGDEASLGHAYQNLGTIYATGVVNLDSALVYLRKSIVCAEMVGDQITLVEDEIELANVLKLFNRNGEAISHYQSALHSSEAMGYLNGMLGAYKNLGIYYNETGDFTTSAIYLKRCMDLASEKGNQLYVNSIRPYLIADYAHMGRFVEMKKELGLFTDDYESILIESNVLDEELERLRENAEDLLNQYESQNDQIQTLQSQRNHYRLAFFGLFVIMFALGILLVAYKIVRKKRTKV